MSEDPPPRELLRQLRGSDLLPDLAEALDREPEDLNDLLSSLASRFEEEPDPDVTAAEPLILYVDGAARNNPGPAGGGAVLLDREERRLAQASEYFGRLTNNAAEYRALLLGLNLLPPEASRLEVRTDSQLMARQIRGEYDVKSDNLRPLYREVQEKLEGLAEVRVNHVPREQNQEADALANRALDSRG